ncbi:MAG: Ribose transport system permease protein RbsC [Actinomycetota bacterium]|jgi:simple sugar transport system permease protein
MADNSSNGHEPHVMTAPLATEAVTTIRRLADNQPTTRWAKFAHNLQFIRGRGAFEISIVAALLVLVYVAWGVIDPENFKFLSSANLSGVLTQSIPLLGILAIAVGILMVAGEFDLSLGFALAFNAVIFIRVAEISGNIWLGVAASLASGTLVALINGAIVVYTKIPSFIATLGMGFFWGGAGLFVNGPNAVALPTEHTKDGDLFHFVFAQDFGFFRSQIVWLVLVGIVAWFFLHRHKLGNHIFAVGGNPAAAMAISINPNKVRLMSFAIYGFLVGLASVIFIARIPSVSPSGTTTQDFMLFAIAAAVVGGTSLVGGKGSVIGMIVGAALIELIKDGLILGFNAGIYMQLFVGVTIVLAAIFNKYMEGKAS